MLFARKPRHQRESIFGHPGDHHNHHDDPDHDHDDAEDDDDDHDDNFGGRKMFW